MRSAFEIYKIMTNLSEAIRNCHTEIRVLEKKIADFKIEWKKANDAWYKAKKNK